MLEKKNAVIPRFSIESRRYIGCKAKLTDWIFSLIDEHTHDVRTFCDIFAGTGVVAAHALNCYEKVVMNDFLHSNNVMYRAFFSSMPWNEEKVLHLIEDFNHIAPDSLRDNYFSKNFGGKFFHHDTAKIIGYIRGRLQQMKSTLTDKEYAVLLASLIYSMDRHAHTLGHYDAYRKTNIAPRPFEFHMVDARSYEGAEIHQEDANALARRLHVDLVYLDPPYNSRQYSRFYHVYENLVQWKKPKLYGVAMKPKEENMSEYCRSGALAAFSDLVSHLDTRYLAVSYNNTYDSKSNSSRNKIELEDLKRVLEMCGSTQMFSHHYSPFNSGKTEFENHQEYLFITEVDHEKRNHAFASLLRG